MPPYVAVLAIREKEVLQSITSTSTLPIDNIVNKAGIETVQEVVDRLFPGVQK